MFIVSDAAFMCFSFHFAKAVLARIKNKLHLGSFLRNKSKNASIEAVGKLFRQIMSLPVLQPHHMAPEVCYLKRNSSC